MPNFGYKNFVDKDADIAKLQWKIEESGPGDYKDIKIQAIDPDSEYAYEGLILARIGSSIADHERGNGVLEVKISKIRVNKWRGTGLGQMLYDRVIQEAKRLGYHYLTSDYMMSDDAKKAWAKLANRYPVQRVKSGEYNEWVYQIDLTKVKDSK